LESERRKRKRETDKKRKEKSIERELFSMAGEMENRNLSPEGFRFPEPLPQTPLPQLLGSKNLKPQDGWANPTTTTPPPQVV
jgi:hypothetical protein